MSLANYIQTEGSLAHSPFASNDVANAIFCFCNVWDLGRLCQTNSMLRDEIMEHFQRHKPLVFPTVVYNDIHTDVHVHNALNYYFQLLYLQSHHETIAQAFEFLEAHRVYHDCHRFYYILDDWNSYHRNDDLVMEYSDDDSETEEIDYP